MLSFQPVSGPEFVGLLLDASDLVHTSVPFFAQRFALCLDLRAGSGDVPTRLLPIPDLLHHLPERVVLAELWPQDRASPGPCLLVGSPSPRPRPNHPTSRPLRRSRWVYSSFGLSFWQNKLRHGHAQCLPLPNQHHANGPSLAGFVTGARHSRSRTLSRNIGCKARTRELDQDLDDQINELS